MNTVDDPVWGTAELKVSGRYFGGWKNLSAEVSMENMSGAFKMDVSERWGSQSQNFDILPGDNCQLYLDGVPVITGYTDDANPSYDKQQHGIEVGGRDNTMDLVDCSAIHKSGQWANVRLDVVARDLIAPFGLKLIVQADLGAAFPSFNIEEGEKVFDCLERACRLRALLVTTDGIGHVVITRASSEVIDYPLVEGENILAASGSFSHKDRFSEYRVKGQDVSTDDNFGENSSHPVGIARDGNIKRYRPLIVLAEDHGNGVTLGERAVWERNVRIGRSCRAEITVRGWTRPDGQLWRPNVMVPVRSPKLYVNANLLISGCLYTMSDDQGSLTRLTVCRREAFVGLPGLGASKLGQKLKAKDAEKSKKSGKQAEDWSML